MSFYVDNDGIFFFNKSSLLKKNNATFRKAFEFLSRDKILKLANKDYIYHGEAVCKRKHNVIIYDRTPTNCFIVYDIYDTKSNCYMTLEDKHKECIRMGFEYVNVFYNNDTPDTNPYDKCKEIMISIENGSLESCLGGTPEGMVLKHESFKSGDKSVATKLKYVSSSFKEKHKIGGDDIKYTMDQSIINLGLSYCTNARFQKAFQHLKERDLLPDPLVFNEDLIRMIECELDADFDKEYMEEVQIELLYLLYPKILKSARSGMQNWFKEYINIPVTDDECKEHTSDTTEKYCIELGLTLRSTDRFINALAKFDESMLNMGKYHILILAFDNEFDNDYREKIKHILWDKFSSNIKAYAKQNLRSWISTILE